MQLEQEIRHLVLFFPLVSATRIKQWQRILAFFHHKSYEISNVSIETPSHLFSYNLKFSFPCVFLWSLALKIWAESAIPVLFLFPVIWIQASCFFCKQCKTFAEKKEHSTLFSSLYADYDNICNYYIASYITRLYISEITQDFLRLQLVIHWNFVFKRKTNSITQTSFFIYFKLKHYFIFPCFSS